MQSTHQTQAIVLAGVHLWEESAFDNATPRPLLPVGQQPLICHVLRWLQRGGIGRATICANSTSRFIRKCLGPGTALGMDLDYYEDWTPRGPAGCAHDAAQGSAAERYVVVDGTIIPQVDLPGLLARHEGSGAAATIAVNAETGGPDPRSPRLSENDSTGGHAACGTQTTAGDRGQGTGDSQQLQQTASGTQTTARLRQLLSPVGVYVFERRALQRAGTVGYQDIKEVLIPRLHADGERIALYAAGGACPRVSGPGSYLAVNEWLLEHFAEQPEAASAYRRRDRAWVHRSARVDATARLIGAVLIGAGSRVGEGAMIVGPSVIGAECVVAAGAILCRSAVWDLCRVGRGASIDRCVLTHCCSVPGGARLYDTVHLPAPEPGRLLQRLQAWTGFRAIPRSLPARRAAARTFDPAAVATGNQGNKAGTPKKPSVGVPVV